MCGTGCTSPPPDSLPAQCRSCPAHWVQPLGEERGKKTVPANAIGGGPCPECGGRVMLGGPYYTGPLQDVPFVDRAIAHLESDDGKGRYATADRILGVLRVAREELPASPLYYDLHATSGALSLSAPTLLTFQSALANAGYRFSQYHGRSTAVKVRRALLHVWADSVAPAGST